MSTSSSPSPACPCVWHQFHLLKAFFVLSLSHIFHGWDLSCFKRNMWKGWHGNANTGALLFQISCPETHAISTFSSPYLKTQNRKYKIHIKHSYPYFNTPWKTEYIIPNPEYKHLLLWQISGLGRTQLARCHNLLWPRHPLFVVAVAVVIVVRFQQ